VKVKTDVKAGAHAFIAKDNFASALKDFAHCCQKDPNCLQ
jgi:hypothetical protein